MKSPSLPLLLASAAAALGLPLFLTAAGKPAAAKIGAHILWDGGK